MQESSHKLMGSGTPLEKASSADMALHMLRSPLTAISGYVDGLLDRWDTTSDEEKHRRLFKISENVTEAFRLAELSGMADPMAEIPLSPRLRDYVAPLREVYEALSPVYNPLRLPDLTHPGSKVWLDEHAFSLILQHLLDNARRYGEPDTEIDVLTAETPDAVGVGVSNWTLPEAPCFLAPPEGVGLYIATRYAERMKGSISVVQNPPLAGVRRLTTFTLWLRKHDGIPIEGEE